jgi:hypothetical protein
LKCPNCFKTISDKIVAQYFGSKGGAKSKRSITPEDQAKMQKGKFNAKKRRSEI